MRDEPNKALKKFTSSPIKLNIISFIYQSIFGARNLCYISNLINGGKFYGVINRSSFL